VTTVIDANVAFEIVSAPDGADVIRGVEAVAPPLLWPETRSALHVARDRGVLSASAATEALKRLAGVPIRERGHRRLGDEAWRIADDLGWAKTYDAEYLALAAVLDARLATFDRRMLRAAERLGIGVHAFA
jgi:predicted nucleic acid-binding protein